MDVLTLLHQNIYIDLYIINSKAKSNRKVIFDKMSFIMELLSPNVTSIEIDANACYTYL